MDIKNLVYIFLKKSYNKLIKNWKGNINRIEVKNIKMNKTYKYNMKIETRGLYYLPTHNIYALEPHTHIVFEEVHKMK